MLSSPVVYHRCGVRTQSAKSQKYKDIGWEIPPVPWSPMALPQAGKLRRYHRQVNSLCQPEAGDLSKGGIPPYQRGRRGLFPEG